MNAPHSTSRASRQRKSLPSPLVIEALEDRTTPGAGTFDATTGTFHFDVALTFDATTAELNRLCGWFTRANEILADALDGQHRFGTVTLHENASVTSLRQAEFVIFRYTGNDWGGYAPMLGAYGLPGSHVEFRIDPGSSYFEDIVETAMVHEFIHHAYGVADSYAGPRLDSSGSVVGVNYYNPSNPNDPSSVENARPGAESPTLNYSIMEAFHLRGGAASSTSPVITLNELSVPGTDSAGLDIHDHDGDTYQTYYSQRDHGVKRSDWETVANSRFPATIPAGLPTDASPTVPTLTCTIVDDASTDIHRVMLTLDKSSSMSTFQRLEFAQAGALAFLESFGAAPGQQIVGLETFNQDADVIDPPDDLANASHLADLQFAIRNNYTAGGLTDITEALLDAVPPLAGSGYKTVLLLSDGDHTVGPPLPDTAIANLQAADIRVVSIGVGSQISADGQALLRRIATDTGGAFTHVASADDSYELIAAFYRYGAEASGGGWIASSEPTTIPTGATRSFTVEVEEGSPRGDFVLPLATPAYGGEFGEVDLTLRSPSGRVITKDTVDADVEFFSNPNLRGFHIRTPEAGAWTMIAENLGEPNRIQSLSYSFTPATYLSVSLREGVVSYPETMAVRAIPYYQGRTVLGATVEGEVLRPDGSQVPITLYDDGSPAHGDVRPGDGVYSALFSGYVPAPHGAYTFDLTATVVGGQAAPVETFGNSVTPPAAQPVPNFIRSGSITGVIRDTPDVVTSANLVVDLRLASGPAREEQPLTYVMTVFNRGTSTAEEVTGTFKLLGPGQILSAASDDGTSSTTDDSGSLDVGTLAPGESAEWTIEVRPEAGGHLYAEGSAGSASQPEASPGDGTATLAPIVEPADVTATVNLAPDQGSPTSVSPVRFTVVFSEGVTGFDPDDIQIGGTAGASTAVVTPVDTATYLIEVGGMTGSGNVTMVVRAGAVVDLDDGQPNQVSNTASVMYRSTLAGQLIDTFAAGAGPGSGGGVTFYDATGSELDTFQAFPTDGSPGGVRVAVADINGDGTPDLIAGTGPGVVTEVRVIDGADRVTELFSVQPFEDGFTGGVYVAAGDVNGDGTPDIAISPDEGGGPRVRLYSGADFSQLNDFFGIEDSSFRGGARVAFGDLNADATADLLVAAGFGGGPRVAGFNGRSLAAGATTPDKLFPDFFVFEQTLRNGVFIAAGDLNADGFADVIAGGGPGGGPRVFALSGQALASTGEPDQVQVANFFAGDTANRGGIRIVAKDLDGDARADLVTGDGTDAGSRVTGYAGVAIPSNDTPDAQLFEFDAFPGFTAGVFVG